MAETTKLIKSLSCQHIQMFHFPPQLSSIPCPRAVRRRNSSHWFSPCHSRHSLLPPFALPRIYVHRTQHALPCLGGRELYHLPQLGLGPGRRGGCRGVAGTECVSRRLALFFLQVLSCSRAPFVTSFLFVLTPALLSFLFPIPTSILAASNRRL